MNKDSVLKVLLRKSQNPVLPHGFEQTVMSRVFREAARQKRRSYYWGISIISFVSLLMVTGSVLALRYFFNVRISIPKPGFSTAGGNLVGFFIFIAAIVLVLLVMDTLFRRMRKTGENGNG